MFKYIFSFFKPKNAEQAAVIKFRLSVVYAILAWNSFILMFYKLMNNDLPTDPAERKNAIINKLSSSQNIKLVCVDGLTVTDNRTMSAASFKEETHLKQSMKE